MYGVIGEIGCADEVRTHHLANHMSRVESQISESRYIVNTETEDLRLWETANKFLILTPSKAILKLDLQFLKLHILIHRRQVLSLQVMFVTLDKQHKRIVLQDHLPHR